MPETLGSHLRASRLRFGFVPSLDAYVRLSATVDGFHVEVCTADKLPHGKARDRGPFICWYTTEVDHQTQAEFRTRIRRIVGPCRLRSARFELRLNRDLKRSLSEHNRD